MAAQICGTRIANIYDVLSGRAAEVKVTEAVKHQQTDCYDLEKENTMANERNEGVIMDELELVEMEEVIAPGHLVTE